MMPVYGTFLFVYCSWKTGKASPSQLKGVSQMYEIELVRGHVEVYLDGVVCFSADTRGEAEREIAELTA